MLSSPGALANLVVKVFSVSVPLLISLCFNDATLGGTITTKLESGKDFENLIAPYTSISSNGILDDFIISLICCLLVP